MFPLEVGIKTYMCPLEVIWPIQAFFPPEREARAAREAPGGINILRTFA
jgi:hypothetical protein